MLRVTETKAHYDDIARDYDRRWPAYIKAETDWVLAHWPPNAVSGGTVLDLGSGTGLMLEQIGKRWPCLELTGVDVSPRMLAEAKKRLPSSRLFEGNLEDTSFTARLPQSNVVLSLSVLHHLNDIDRHLRLLGRLVRPGGTVFLGDFACDGVMMNIGETYFRWFQPYYNASLPHATLAKKVAQFFPSATVAQEILRPDWFWRIQIFRLDIGSV